MAQQKAIVTLVLTFNGDRPKKKQIKDWLESYPDSAGWRVLDQMGEFIAMVTKTRVRDVDLP